MTELVRDSCNNSSASDCKPGLVCNSFVCYLPFKIMGETKDIENTVLVINTKSLILCCRMEISLPLYPDLLLIFIHFVIDTFRKYLDYSVCVW